jgi:hypothetical protein
MANFRFSTHQSSGQLHKIQVEDSLLLRVLVQMMICISIVTIGIVTSSDQGILFMMLAIVSGYWSWHVRHRRNYWLVRLITLSYMIAISS